MPKRRSAWVAAVAVVFLLVCASLPRSRAQSIFPDQTAYTTDVCDRACLYGFVDQYLHALSDKSPSLLPWAKFVRFTENNVALKVGDSLWGTISGLGPEDLRAADPEHGEVAYFGVVYEQGTPSYLAMRMKIVDRKIAEVETIVDRKGNGPGPFGDPTKMTELPLMKEDVPAEQRTPRQRMIALADGYDNTLQLNDGHIYTIFDPACSRRENGVWTANDPHPDANATGLLAVAGKISCEQGFKLGNYHWDDRLRARRFPLVDEEKGLVLAAGFIDHSGRLKKYTTTDGVIHDSPMKSPHSFCLLEMFKIIDGKIRHAEAIFITVPYNMPSPWLQDAPDGQ
jgi:hypothetical protein